MDELEKIISQNREFFKQNDLPQGHLGRFEARLKKEKKSVIRMLSPWMAAAAVVIVVLMIPLLQNREEPIGPLSEVSEQYTEVEYYFTSSIKSSVKEFNTMVEAGVATESDQEMVQEELKELELRHQQLQKDLKLAPNDERIINAMIVVYQKKLELMNQILEQLYEVKKQQEKFEGNPESALSHS